MGLSQNVVNPFPNHSTYYAGVVTPNHVSQSILDSSTKSFYEQWKNKYIKSSSCSDSYYVWADSVGKNIQCVSEGQGYGMIILVLMAGYEKDAQNIFDKLFKYYQEHPSKRSKHLMSWAQGKDCLKFEESSAADGDIDIAFSLLLADAQWKTQSRINYLQEAQKIINSIKIQEINHETFNILQSNSIEPDSKDYFDMRSSDFIPSELRSFIFTDSVTWQKVLTNNYNLFIRMQKKFSEGPGLIPDFIQHISIQPRPANQFYLESKYDGEYNFNASRVPWRIATDYIINGEKLANSFIVPINKWIRETTGNNPDNISAGYTLKGEDIKSRNFESLSFITSFAIAAMIDKKNQTWLNKLWDYITGFKISEFG